MQICSIYCLSPIPTTFITAKNEQLEGSGQNTNISPLFIETSIVWAPPITEEVLAE